MRENTVETLAHLSQYTIGQLSHQKEEKIGTYCGDSCRSCCSFSTTDFGREKWSVFDLGTDFSPDTYAVFILYLVLHYSRSICNVINYTVDMCSYTIVLILVDKEQSSKACHKRSLCFKVALRAIAAALSRLWLSLAFFERHILELCDSPSSITPSIGQHINISLTLVNQEFIPSPGFPHLREIMLLIYEFPSL